MGTFLRHSIYTFIYIYVNKFIYDDTSHNITASKNSNKHKRKRNTSDKHNLGENDVSGRYTVRVFINDLLEMKFVTSAARITSAAVLASSKSTEFFHLCTWTGNIISDGFNNFTWAATTGHIVSDGYKEFTWTSRTGNIVNKSEFRESTWAPLQVTSSVIGLTNLPQHLEQVPSSIMGLTNTPGHLNR